MAWQRQGSDGKYWIPCYRDERTRVANNPRAHLDSIITEGGPFSDPDSDLGQGTIARLEAANVLLVSILIPPSKPPTDQSLESCTLPSTCFLQMLELRTHSGAGGLGCEILKNLALSGFKDIHVIDMGISCSVEHLGT